MEMFYLNPAFFCLFVCFQKPDNLFVLNVLLQCADLPFGRFVVNQHFHQGTEAEERKSAKLKWVPCLFIKNVGLVEDRVETIALNGS